MENNDLKEKIRKNVKERIAVSNIREEFDMKTNINKKIAYAISSICAVFILGIGILVGAHNLNNNLFQNENVELGEEESLKIDLNINRIKEAGLAKFDADIENINAEKLPGELKFMETIIIPTEFKLVDMYKIYVRSNQDIKKYDLLHDYVFEYQKDEENDIRIAISTVENPIRDYYLGENNEISRIGDVELKITQYEKMYMASFRVKDIYFDIETQGITESELVETLKSIIIKIK